MSSLHLGPGSVLLCKSYVLGSSKVREKTWLNYSLFSVITYWHVVVDRPFITKNNSVVKWNGGNTMESLHKPVSGTTINVTLDRMKELIRFIFFLLENVISAWLEKQSWVFNGNMLRLKQTISIWKFSNKVNLQTVCRKRNLLQRIQSCEQGV